ncbi:Vacuolar protein sorting-associated protein 29 [Pichia californica]|nr:Vacuolar protein sorting-associated protein 29 [[Candida] californica]
MGASYNILGKQVASQWLAIATLAGVVGGIKLNSFLAADAPAADAPAAPAPAAGELDVEKAINDFLASKRAIDIPAKFKKLLQPKGKIEKVLCLGNITNSPSTLSFLKNISNDFQMIRGEDDSDLSLPQSLVMTYDSLKIGLINGFQIIPKNDPLSLLNHARMMDADVLIYGSTHKVEAYTLDGKFFVNPGTGSGAYSTDPLDKQDKLMINKIIDSVHKGENLESNKQKIDTADDHINDHSNVEKVTTDKLNNNDNKDLPKDSPAVDVNQDNHDNDNNNSNDDDDDDDNDNNNDDDNNENKITNNQGDSVPDSNL